MIHRCFEKQELWHGQIISKQVQLIIATSLLNALRIQRKSDVVGNKNLMLFKNIMNLHLGARLFTMFMLEQK